MSDFEALNSLLVRTHKHNFKMNVMTLNARRILAVLAVIAVCTLLSCSSDNDEPVEPPKPEVPEPGVPEVPEPDDVCLSMNDINFMKFCYDNFDVNKDQRVSKLEAMAVTEMEIPANNIKSLQGIGHFKNLTKLSIANPITSLDLSENILLTSIVLSNPELTSLDISKNTKLTSLTLESGTIGELNVSDCIELEYLKVDAECTLSDISKNTKLISLTLENVPLSSLNISGCTQLEYLHVSGDDLTALDTSNCKELTFLYVSGAALASLDIKENILLDTLFIVNNTALTSLDVSNNQKLKYLDATSSDLEEILLAPDQTIEALKTSPQTDVKPIEPIPSDRTGTVEFELGFAPLYNGTRASSSRATPNTSWKNIKQVQLFLYDDAGVVKYSATVNPVSNFTKFVYTNIPVGVYTVVAVANTKSSTDAIHSFMAGSEVEWNNYNVRTQAISDLYLKHKPSTFPSFAKPMGATAYAQPSEIFMAEATNVIVTHESQTLVKIPLKREVAMMRVRVNVKESDAACNNSSTGAGGINWGTETSIQIINLPDVMKITAGNTGGVSATSTQSNVMVAHTGPLNTTNPSYGQIIDGNFTMWKDILVFPNNGGRVNDAIPSMNATANQKYFIVLSAQGQVGHVLANGTELANTSTVYWYGSINCSFVRNHIREVNLTLMTGGTTSIPNSPVEYGGMKITIEAPFTWDNVVQTEF